MTDLPDKVADFTEHQLLEKIYESFLVLIKLTNDVKKEQSQVLRTKRFTAFLLVVVFVFVIALQVQIQTRNSRLDKFNDRLSELKVSVAEIEKVADDVKAGNPQQSKAVAEGLDRINKICIVLHCEVPTTTTGG